MRKETKNLIYLIFTITGITLSAFNPEPSALIANFIALILIYYIEVKA